GPAGLAAEAAGSDGEEAARRAEAPRRTGREEAGGRQGRAEAAGRAGEEAGGDFRRAAAAAPGAEAGPAAGRRPEGYFLLEHSDDLLARPFEKGPAGQGRGRLRLRGQGPDLPAGRPRQA